MAMSWAAKPRAEIQAFCREHRNEDAHTEYVTQLALTLFDAVRPVLELPVEDRHLLEAAAFLHDVGYADDPARHMERGVELVRQATWDSFRPNEIAVITAIMSLHQKGGPLVADAPGLADLDSPMQAARLGAILRLADGLDQSHIQDARIKDIEVDTNPIVVRVKSGLSTQNIVAANRRADLWHDVFKIGITFIATSTKRTQRVPKLKKSDQPLEYFRRHAYRSLKAIREDEEGAMTGERPEALHQLRVQNRRFRTLLQIFRKPLRQTEAAMLRQRLDEVGAALGPARDHDVWQARVNEWLENGQADDRLREYYAEQQQAAQSEYDAVRTLLESPAYRALMRDCTVFLRVAVPACIRHASGGRVDKFGAKMLKRRMQRLRRALREAEEVTGESGHEVRKHVRRARYVAECFAPVLGKRVKRLGRKLKKTADALGRLRDTELGLDRIQRDPQAPPSIQQWLLEEKEQRVADAQQALQKLRRET